MGRVGAVDSLFLLLWRWRTEAQTLCPPHAGVRRATPFGFVYTQETLDVAGCEPSDKVEVRGCNTQSCCLAHVFDVFLMFFEGLISHILYILRSPAGNGNGCTDGLWGEWGSWQGAQLLTLCMALHTLLRTACTATCDGGTTYRISALSVPNSAWGIKQLLSKTELLSPPRTYCAERQ